MTVATLPPSAADAVEMMARAAPEWSRMSPDEIGGEIELATIMPGNSRSDYIRAAAMCLHLAERLA